MLTVNIAYFKDGKATYRHL